MSKKIYGVTVGTPLSPAKIAEKLKPVKTVNGIAPDENGNVEVQGGSADAVLYTKQTLTANQKAQARENIGITGTGKDGVSVTHKWNGTVLSVTSASGTSSADLKGDDGITPHIGSNGNWWIGNTDTGVSAGGSGGGGATPDWNAVLGAPGHILNRTHWVDVTKGEEIPVSGSWNNNNGTEDTFSFLTPINLEAGKSYVVEWNGVEYQCTAIEIEYQGISAVGIGNTLLIGGEDTGEPFGILGLPDADDAGETVWIAVAVTPGAVPFYIYHGTEVVHKLDAKYLPDGGSSIFLVNITDNEDGSCTSSHTGKEISDAFNAGSLPVAIRKGSAVSGARVYSYALHATTFMVHFICLISDRTIEQLMIPYNGTTPMVERKEFHELTFTGAVSATYDGSEAVSIEIPAGGGGSSEWKLIATQTTTEAGITSIQFDLDGTYEECVIQMGGIGDGKQSIATSIRVNGIQVGNQFHDFHQTALRVGEVFLTKGGVASESGKYNVEYTELHTAWGNAGRVYRLVDGNLNIAVQPITSIEVYANYSGRTFGVGFIVKIFVR